MPCIVIRASCVVVVVLLCVAIGCGKDNNGRLGQQPIRLIDLNDKSFDFWQKPPAITVVLFTRSDCPISNRCAPEIRRLYNVYHSRGVEFYLVYVDPHEQPDSIRQHMREYAYPCQGLRDPRHTLVAHCGTTITPEAAVFDKDRVMTYRGRVDDLYVDFGQARAEATSHDLGDAIESTLLGRTVANPRTKAIGCLIADLKD